MVNPRFFRRAEVATPGPSRDFVGYADDPPRLEWPDGQRVAVQLVINYEEGSELSYSMGDQQNDDLHELGVGLVGHRDLAVDSEYEYGARAGIWRLSGCSMQLECQPPSLQRP